MITQRKVANRLLCGFAERKEIGPLTHGVSVSVKMQRAPTFIIQNNCDVNNVKSVSLDNDISTETRSHVSFNSTAGQYDLSDSWT